MTISCDIIKDLLPLYYDHVCSEKSSKLVEEHLKTCDICSAELQKIDMDIKGVNPMENTKPIRAIAVKWKQDKLSAFLKGILLISILSCVGCLIAFNVIGSYVAEDGTLVEAFGFIPMSFLFCFIGILSALGLGIIALVRRIKNNH